MRGVSLSDSAWDVTIWWEGLLGITPIFIGPLVSRGDAPACLLGLFKEAISAMPDRYSSCNVV